MMRMQSDDFRNLFSSVWNHPQEMAQLFLVGRMFFVYAQHGQDWKSF